eukprot:Rhum_TRINITY_DN15248_c6_g1::Rhum_TRINITY_DN15248_c6_g1_i1::g.143870::m.143870
MRTPMICMHTHLHTNRAAKVHQLQQVFGCYPEEPLAPQPYRSSRKRPPSSSGSTRSARSVSTNASYYTQEMDDRISRLEKTIEEERSGRRQVQEQLDTLRKMIETNCELRATQQGPALPPPPQHADRPRPAPHTRVAATRERQTRGGGGGVSHRSEPEGRDRGAERGSC